METLEAVLQLRIDSFLASLQQASQAVATFATSLSGGLAGSASVFQAQIQQITQVAEATRKTSETVRNTKKAEVADAKSANDELHQQYVAMAAFEAKITKEASAARRVQMRDDLAQEKATSDALMSLVEERVQNERQAAANVVAAWVRAGADIERADMAAAVRQEQRIQARTARVNTQANAAIASITGGPVAAPGQEQLFLLQGYINLIQQATSQTSVFDSAIARIGTSFRTLGGYLIAGALIKLPFEIAQWGKESVETAVKMQSLQATFAAITGSTAAAQRELAFIRTTAQRAGVDFLEAAGSFKSLEAAARGTKLEGEGVRRIFEQVTNAARVMGLSSEQVSRIMLAMEQMISRGTVSAEELRKQLGNALPGAVQIMSRAMGVTTAELGDLMKNAELLAVDVLPKFGAQLQREFGPGFASAAESAQATFARFGNNVRDISVSVGDAILAILKPVIDTINRGFELYQKAKAEAQAQIAEGTRPLEKLAPIPGAPDLEGMLGRARQELDHQQKVLQTMNAEATAWISLDRPTEAALDSQRKMVEALQKAYDKLLEQRKLFLESQGEGGAEQTDAPFAKQTKAVGEAVKDLDTQLEHLSRRPKLIPAMLMGDGQLDLAREKVREITRAIGKVFEEIDKAKGLDAALTKPLESQTQQLNARLAAANKEVEVLEAADEARKQAARDEERLEKERLANAKALAADKIALEDKMRVAIAAFDEDTSGKIREQLLLTLMEAKRVYADQTLTAQYESVKRMEAAQKEGQKIIEEHDAIAAILRDIDETQRAIQEETTALQAEGTKTRLDDFVSSMDKRRAAWEDELDHERITQEQFDAFVSAAEGKKTRIAQEEQDKLNKEAGKSWRELASTIEGVLGSAFNSILSGSKNLFEGIRDAFLKLLAKLAADALTHAVIIPAIVSIVGGAAGMAGAAGGGSIFGGTGLAGAGALGATGAGGEAGASGTLQTALGFASAGNAVSGALGGPSIGLGTGGFGAQLAATQIGNIPGIGGLFGGLPAGVAGPPTALAATTVGTVLGGAGAGIAVGMILSKINSMLGVHGIANTTLAGAGGGALAGTIIMPGIGTAVGAVVGAIGGAIAGLIGKEGKQPGFKIESLQPGQISYDENIGLRVKQDFKILDDFHQKLGTDYEDFIKGVEDGFNELFQNTISQISGATPQVQQALVDPLNEAFQSIATQIEQYQAIGGDKFKEKFTTMMGTDIPKIFADAANGAIGKFVEAVKKIDPVIQAFNTIIDSIMGQINELHKQQLALDASLEGNITTLRESLMTPAELLRVRQDTFQALMGRFTSGNEMEKILLAPVIGQLSTEIFDLAKTVFSTQSQQFNATGIEQAIKAMQESLFTPAQTLEARRNDLDALMTQFRASDDTIKAGLVPQITALAQQIMELTKGVNQLAEAQALMADFPAQLRAITEAFYSPAQSYLSMRDQLDILMSEFRSATPARRIELEPQIAQFAAQILQVARGQDVLGQDPQLMRNVQADMLSVVKEMQAIITNQADNAANDQASVQAVLERTQGEMLSVLREVQNGMVNAIVNSGANLMNALFMTSGNIIGTDHYLAGAMINATYQTTNGVITAQYTTGGQFVGAQYATANGVVAAVGGSAWQTANMNNSLWYLQGQLINQVSGVQAVVWATYSGLAQALWVEIGLAQEQITLLVNSLYHLETVDAVIQNALGVLGEMNWRLGNPLGVTMGENLMTQLQRDSLWVAQQSLRVQQQGTIAIIGLQAMAAVGMGWQQALNFGSYVVGVGQGFQHGGYVPQNMLARLHQGEQVIPEWSNRHGGGRGTTISVNVYGGNKDVTQIADAVVDRIEAKSGRLQSSRIQVGRR